MRITKKRIIKTILLLKNRPSIFFKLLFLSISWRKDQVRDLLTRELSINSFHARPTEDFFSYMVEMQSTTDKEHINYFKHEFLQTDFKLIAMYLPQFHQFKENDEFWGKGFTEWTNTSKALPQFKGHYQPKLPGELGFYDLNSSATLERQINLAKNYGIYGFCFYYYWFHGHKLMTSPIEKLYKRKELDFPFCISWANENWTKTWEGNDSEVLMDQKHSAEDDIAFIKDVAKFMKDRRYIKINSRPVLIVYRPKLFPDMKATAGRWRKWCRENGLGELFLITTHQIYDNVPPKEIGFDSAMEMAPMNHMRSDDLSALNDKVTFFNKNFSGIIYNIDSILDYVCRFRDPGYKKFRGACPSWDNEARRPGKGILLGNTTPAKYRKWMEYLLEYTRNKFNKDEQFIFINAWNEWAEGAYLEPDRKYGHSYLEATYQALKSIERSNKQPSIQKKNEIAIVIHLYYVDTWDFFKEQLAHLDFSFDLYVTTTSDNYSEVKSLVLPNFKHGIILSYPNRGRDILPFLKLYTRIKPFNYTYICKLHSKQSTHLDDGQNWGEQTISNLLKNTKQAFDMFESNSTIGIVAPKGSCLLNKDFIASNIQGLKKVEAQLKHGDILSTDFVAGSMMWLSPKAINGIELLFDTSEFEIEIGQVDGTIAHTVERVISYVASSNGFITKEIHSNDDTGLPAYYRSQKT